MRTYTYKKVLLQYITHIVVVIITIISYPPILHAFAQTVCLVASGQKTHSATLKTEHAQELEQKSITLFLQEYGTVQEDIVLNIDIPKSMIPKNAWGRVAIKSSIIFKDGSMHTGHIHVLEGVPESILRFTKKGLYELTISLGYLIKST